MNTPSLRQLKMAWLAAREAGNQQEQLRLLTTYPEQQDDLIDFIAAYHATGGDTIDEPDADVLTEVSTQRAIQKAFDRVFPVNKVQKANIATLTELRKALQLSKVEIARRLRLSVDVWNKFESGAIDLLSMTQQQIERIASCLTVSSEQFGNLLTNSQPAISPYRRQTARGSRNRQQGPQIQSFAEAIARSTMPQEDKEYWTE